MCCRVEDVHDVIMSMLYSNAKLYGAKQLKMSSTTTTIENDDDDDYDDGELEYNERLG